MDLALPPQPFSTVFVPASGDSVLQIPADMRNDGMGAPSTVIELPIGVVQVIVTWKGVDPISVRHFTGNTTTSFETVATIPASSTVGDRSTGVLTLASDKRQGILLYKATTAGWNANTLSKGYVAGLQVIPMGTTADITGGGSLLRTDTSVGKRVFLGDQMIFGDTGWRNISNLASNLDFSASIRYGMWIRKIGDVVHFHVLGDTLIDPSEPQAGLLTKSLPVEFSPIAADGVGLFLRVGTLIVAGNVRPFDTSYSANRLRLSIFPTNGNRVEGVSQWVARPTWPRSLPGTAV